MLGTKVRNVFETAKEKRRYLCEPVTNCNRFTISNIMVGISYSQSYRLAQQWWYGIAYLHQLLAFLALEDEIVGERLQPCHLPSR